MSSSVKNDNAFPVERLRMIGDIEQTHFWFRGRRQLVTWLLEKYIKSPVNTVIDLGCGTGHNLPYWLDFGQCIVGLDRLMAAAPHRHQYSERIDTLAASVYGLPLQTNSVDLVISLDVLEHVADHETVDEIKRVLKVNGTVVITVPATPWLWSSRDRQAGHLRRYTTDTLSRLFEENGFAIMYMNYYQCLLFPLALASRLLWRNKEAAVAAEERPGKVMNTLLSFVTTLELLLVKTKVPLPWGTSLILVATKRT